MTVPRIGLTTYARNADNWFQLPAEYVDSVRRAGGLPVLLPPGEARRDLWLANLDGLVLTGGGDLHPEHYGGTDHTTLYNTDEDRDRDELSLARHLVQSGLPGLCICRGLQVLNVALGGTLIPHLPDAAGERIAHRTEGGKPTPHGVTIEAGSRLTSVLGTTEASGASWHHQAIDRLGSDLEVVARAPDGTIEAVEIPALPSLVAVQWHPELTAAQDPVQQRLFDEVVRAARERMA